MLEHGTDEEQHAEEGVRAQEEQLPAVVVPVGARQITRRVVLLLLFQIGRLQPVCSTGEDGGEATPKEDISFKPSDQISFLFFSHPA